MVALNPTISHRFEPHASSRVEERRADATNGDTLLRDHVWGHYVDELVQQREYAGAPGTADASAFDHEDLYPLQDLHFSASALTHGSGAIVEAYDVDAYGLPRIYRGPGVDGRWFTDDDARWVFDNGLFVPPELSSGEVSSDSRTLSLNPLCNHLYQGRYFDPETGLHQFRARYYHPKLGRFLTRDPRGYEAGLNLYEFEGGMPMEAVDPGGELAWVPLLVWGGTALFGASTLSFVHNANKMESAVESGNVEAFSKAQAYANLSLLGAGFGLGLAAAPIALFVGGGALGAAGYVAIEGAVFAGISHAAESYSRGDGGGDILRSSLNAAGISAVAGLVLGGGAGPLLVRLSQRPGLRRIPNVFYGEIAQEVGWRTSGVYSHDSTRRIVLDRLRGRTLGHPSRRVVMRRLSKQNFRNTLRHELAHWAMHSQFIAIDFLDVFVCRRSHLVKYLDEFIPELYATKSLVKSLQHPLKGGRYGISGRRLAGESVVFGSFLAGTALWGVREI